MNSDEALKCLALSKRKFEEGDSAAALRFAAKSLKLNQDNADAKNWMVFLEKQRGTSESTSKPSPSQRTPPLKTSESASASASTQSPAPSRPFTQEQVEGIKRIKAVKAKGDLYGILGLEKEGCTDADIKRAYRKLALQYHPDKCGAPGTDEAFKAIGHAFAVLGDEPKREQYDRYGIDPESSASRSAASSAPSGAFRHGGFGEEISPEDLFNMFFNDLAGGGGGGGGVQFSFGGGPHFRRQFRTQRDPSFQQRRFRSDLHNQQQHQHQNTTASLSQFLQLIPLLLLVLFSLMSMFVGSDDLPSYAFERTRTYGMGRMTRVHGVEFWVNQREWEKKGLEGNAGLVIKLDEAVEAQMLNSLRVQCMREREYKAQQIGASRNLFFGVDDARLARARSLPTPFCDRLVEWERVEQDRRAAAAANGRRKSKKII